MGRRQKNLWMTAFLMVPVVLLLACQCIYAAPAAEPEVTPSCHSREAQKDSNAADCCGRCEVESAAIIKGKTSVEPFFEEKPFNNFITAIEKFSPPFSKIREEFLISSTKRLSQNKFHNPDTVRGPPLLIFS